MKILFATGIFPNRTDINRGIYIFSQARALKRHAEVEAIAPVPYFPGFLKSKRYSSFTSVPKQDTLDGIPVQYPRYFVIPKIFRALHGLFLVISVFWTYRKTIRRFKPDIILGFHAYPYCFANVVLGKLLKVPVFSGCIGSDINYLAQKFWQGKLIRWALRNSRRVLCVSAALGDQVVELGVDRNHLSVITNGVDLNLFKVIDRLEARGRVGLEPDGRLGVAVGRLSPEKGLDVLINALKHVKTPDFKLIIVGSGMSSAALKEQADRLGLTDRIQFAGSRPNEEVPVWINAADVLILPSRNEGHPNVLMETLACGVPVVATRVGGVPEIITSDRFGFIVPSDHPPEMGEAIDKVLSRDWDRTDISGTITRDWNQVVEEILEVVREDPA